jgi:hypothetical protein
MIKKLIKPTRKGKTNMKTINQIIKINITFNCYLDAPLKKDKPKKSKVATNFSPNKITPTSSPKAQLKLHQLRPKSSPNSQAKDVFSPNPHKSSTSIPPNPSEIKRNATPNPNTNPNPSNGFKI